jgi:hypothetical protein
MATTGAAAGERARLWTGKSHPAAIVQGTRTPPSHGGNPGSNPGSGTPKPPYPRGFLRFRGGAPQCVPQSAPAAAGTHRGVTRPPPRRRAAGGRSGSRSGARHHDRPGGDLLPVQAGGDEVADRAMAGLTGRERRQTRRLPCLVGTRADGGGEECLGSSEPNEARPCPQTPARPSAREAPSRSTATLNCAHRSAGPGRLPPGRSS